MSTSFPNAKLGVLRKYHTLNPRSDEVMDQLFLDYDFFDPHDIVQVRYEMLRRVSMEGMPVTAAAALFGFSRVAFYQTRKRFEELGIVGLLPRRRGPRRAHKLTAEVMDYVEGALLRDPSLRAQDLVNLLEKRFSFGVHPRSIERALVRHQKKLNER